jgi:hypothetical protein
MTACRYSARMSQRDVDRPASGELVIEFPDDPGVIELPDVEEMHASVETEDPPDTHSIHERWARLVDVGGGM